MYVASHMIGALILWHESGILRLQKYYIVLFLLDLQIVVEAGRYKEPDSYRHSPVHVSR